MIYFDNSATTRFKPKCVLDEFLQFQIQSCNSGRSGYTDCIDIATKVFKTRENIKAKLGANDDYEVIFTKNCTESLNIAILGFLKPHQHIITTLNEHNSVLRTLEFMKEKFGIEISYIPPDKTGKISPNHIKIAIKSNTALIICNQTSNVTGATSDIFEIGKIAKSHNIKLLVDTAQSLGHQKINMFEQNIDMLASCGHKGIHGLQGTGFLVVKRDIQLNHTMFGGTGTDSDLLAQPNHLPEGYECGTLNTGGILALNKAFDWTYANFDLINNHCKLIANEIYYGLKSMKKIHIYSPPQSTVISISVDGYTSGEVSDILNNNNIAVRSGLHCAPLIHQHLGTLKNGLTRISVGYNNSIGDCYSLLQVLKKL